MRITLLLILFAFTQTTQAQFPTTSSSSDIFHALQKVENGTSVLYIAAHPDDENTRLIAFFENKKHFKTGYLSLTRGDGGQNLIGTEIGAGIGVLRTQELLGARSIDGGEQFFTRAVDFGYSKSSEESFEKWDRDSILSDMVWVIRNFKPDVIVTRFPPTDYAGHGHHKASAILAEEAFDLAADSNAYPHQLKFTSPWQTGSMYFNTSSWWVKDLEKQAADSEDFLRVDVGEYNPIIGESYSQIAARARSQHRSQGFGSDYPNGIQIEYLKYVKGDRISDFNQPFDSRWEENKLSAAQKQIQKTRSSFDFAEPSNAVPLLIKAAQKLQEAPASYFRNDKIEEINNLILSCLAFNSGLYFPENYVVPNSKSSARLNLTNPSDLEIEVIRASFRDQQWEINQSIGNNELFSESYAFDFPDDFSWSNPYWLNEPYLNTYVVNDLENIGKPQNDPAIFVELEMVVDGYALKTTVPAQNKEVDPAIGVIYKPVYVVPALSFNFSEDVLVATGNQEKSIFITITNFGDSIEGSVRLDCPDGWTIVPEQQKVIFYQNGGSQRVEFTVKSSTNSEDGFCKPIWTSASNEEPTYSLTEIDYEHIPAQIILKPAQMAFKPIDLDRGQATYIGYIDGSGDDVDKYLRAAGYRVDIIAPEDLLSNGILEKYDAIVTGIRAYNTREDLAFANDKLNAFVENGGTWIVQYNTSRKINIDQIGPYPFTLSRERVTNEFAEVTILAPNHLVMNSPNKLGNADWDHWVQERGLYFAGDWDKSFEPIISWSDGDEPARNGGLIIAQYGQGHFVYTGISFFRELPAGVPGAYRLLANILDLSSQESNQIDE